MPGEPLPDSPPPLPPRQTRRQRQREESPAVDPTGRVNVPDDPNLSTCPDPVGEQILSDAFPHLPDPLSRDPRDVDQPLVPANEPTNPSPQNDSQRQGGAGRQRVLSFSKPKKGNFSFRRRRPDVNALRAILTDVVNS